jgi:hypothetical protein
MKPAIMREREIQNLVCMSPHEDHHALYISRCLPFREQNLEIEFAIFKEKLLN